MGEHPFPFWLENKKMQTDRLNMIIKHTTGQAVADIGTDHAYIPVQLIQQKKAERVIATDVRTGPLEAARRSIAKAGVCGIELRLGSGLSPIAPGECDDIIIAGMGGELICTILAEGEKTAKKASRLLLQPMNSQDMLRDYLSKNGYFIAEEDIVCEGFKVYNLIIAYEGAGRSFCDETELHLPVYLRQHSEFPALVQKKLREFTKILNGLERAKEKNYFEIERYRRLLAAAEELKGK